MADYSVVVMVAVLLRRHFCVHAFPFTANDGSMEGLTAQNPEIQLA